MDRFMDFRGLRVVRKPNWSAGNSDGGEGFVGTLADVTLMEISVPSSVGGNTPDVVVQPSVKVLWDNGELADYTIDDEGKFDLLVYDSAQIGIRHEEKCQACDQTVEGALFSCESCPDYFLCSECCSRMKDIAIGKHNSQHFLKRLDAPNVTSVLIKTTRWNAAKIKTKGVFQNAKIVRSRFWRFEDQDGGEGNIGTVQMIKGHAQQPDHPRTARSVAQVQWDNDPRKTSYTYSIGHLGFADISLAPKIYVEGAPYLPSHLARLGEGYFQFYPSTASGLSSNATFISAATEIAAGSAVSNCLSEVAQSFASLALSSRFQLHSSASWHQLSQLSAAVDFPEHSLVKVVASSGQEFRDELNRSGCVYDCAMDAIIGEIGFVQQVVDVGVRVYFHSRLGKWTISLRLLQPVDLNDLTLPRECPFRIEDNVRIIADKQRIAQVQASYDYLRMRMLKAAGKTGTVRLIHPASLEITMQSNDTKCYTLHIACIEHYSSLTATSFSSNITHNNSIANGVMQTQRAFTPRPPTLAVSSVLGYSRNSYMPPASTVMYATASSSAASAQPAPINAGNQSRANFASAVQHPFNLNSNQNNSTVNGVAQQTQRACNVTPSPMVPSTTAIGYSYNNSYTPSMLAERYAASSNTASTQAITTGNSSHMTFTHQIPNTAVNSFYATAQVPLSAAGNLNNLSLVRPANVNVQNTVTQMNQNQNPSMHSTNSAQPVSRTDRRVAGFGRGQRRTSTQNSNVGIQR